MIIFFGTMAGNFIIAANYQNKLVLISLFNVVVNVLANLILIPRYSYMGASIVTIFTEAMSCLLAFILIYKYLKFIPNFKVFFKALLSALIMGLYLYYFSGHGLLFLIISSGLIYLVFLYVLGGINKKMIKEVIEG